MNPSKTVGSGMKLIAEAKVGEDGGATLELEPASHLCERGSGGLHPGATQETFTHDAK